MAFNPFNWFRKHQKLLIAIVTIFIMFIFVLQFGPGDVFGRLGNMFGRSRERGQAVATLNGTQLREGDLEKLARQRKLANDFIFAQVWDAHPRVLTKIIQEKTKADPKADVLRDPLASLRTICQAAQQRLRLISDPRQLQFMMQIGQDPRERIMREFEQIPGDLRQLEAMADTAAFKDDPDRLALLEQVTTILGFQRWMLPRWESIGIFIQTNKERMPQDLYFGGGNKRFDDLLDFAMWRQQADRLGIQLTDADVAREVNREAAGHEVFDPATINFDSDKLAKEILARREFSGFNLSGKDLATALRDEFRVSLAQGVMVGFEPGVRAYRSLLSAYSSPSVGTPDEFLSFVREMRTSMKVMFLPLPAENFLSKVTGQPSDAELRARFEKYKDQEPSPGSREPGFKEPRRVKVEYVVASPDDAHYREEGRKGSEAWLKYSNPTSRAGGVFGTAVGSPSVIGAGAFGPVMSLSTAVALDPLGSDYEGYVNAQTPWLPLEDTGMSMPITGRFRHSSIADPTTATVTLGGVTAAAGRAGNILTALNGIYLTGIVHEIKGGTRQVASQILVRSDPQQLYGAAALALALNPKTLPQEQMTPELVSSLRDRLPETLLRSNLATIRSEMEKLKGKPKEIEAYLAKAVKEYALKRGAMPKPMSEHELADALARKIDVGLTPLREAFKSLFMMRPIPEQARDQAFSRGMVQEQGVYEAQRLNGMPPSKDELLFWRSEESQVKVPESFEAVRDKVLEQWRLSQARILASQAAEQIRTAINDKQLSAADAERVLREKQAGLGEMFELENIAMLLPRREVQMSQIGDYQTFAVPEDKVKLMPYPPMEMVRVLLALERPGEATVIADGPSRTYYVAVLMARDEPDLRQFRQIYSLTPDFDKLFNRFRMLRNEEYRRTVTEQLRREAAGGKLDKEGRWDIPEDIRKRDERGRDDFGD